MTRGGAARGQTMDEVDFTVLAAKSVFTDMMDKCPPAETCRDAFDRTAKETIKMASSSGGFGVAQPRRQRGEATGWAATGPDASALKPQPRQGQQQSEQAHFELDMSMSDGPSSPGLAAAGEMDSPRMRDGSQAFGADAEAGSRPHSRNGRSRPAGGAAAGGGDPDAAIDVSLAPPPPAGPRRAGGALMGQGQQYARILQTCGRYDQNYNQEALSGVESQFDP